MEGTGALTAFPKGVEHFRAGRMSSEAAALRLALMVGGIVLFVPNVIYAVSTAYSLASLQSFMSDDFRGYIWTANLILFVTVAGRVVIGFLLVWGSWRQAAPTVSSLLYPALIIIGTYLLFLGAIGIALSTAQFMIFDEAFSIGIILLYAAMRLPEILAGVALVLIGVGRFPRRWKGPVIDRSGF